MADIIDFEDSDEILVPSMTASWHQLLLELTLEIIPETVKGEWRNFYNGVFPKWIMDAINSEVLDQDLQLAEGKQFSDIVTWKDVKYFCDKNKVVSLPPQSLLDSHEVPPLNISLPTLNEVQLEQLRKLWYKEGDWDDSELEEEFKTDVNHLLALYIGMGGSSNFFSVPPPVKKGCIELFGNPFNVNCGPQEYCSGFPFEKERFGSLGSVFEQHLEPGRRYIANPYFGETVMLQLSKWLIAEMKRLTEENANPAIVIVTFPNWTQFEALDELLLYPDFIKYRTVLGREYGFYNPMDQRYLQICQSVFIILSSNQTSNDEWKTVQKVNPVTKMGVDLIELWSRTTPSVSKGSKGKYHPITGKTEKREVKRDSWM
jgi:hypothetical protein